MAVLGVLLLTATAGAEEFGSLTVQQVQAKRTQKNVYLFDNNAKDRWAEGHVPGAKWLNPYTVKAGDFPADKTATLIFYCASPH